MALKLLNDALFSNPVGMDHILATGFNPWVKGKDKRGATKLNMVR
jgi:hypothetical protein